MMRQIQLKIWLSVIATILLAVGLAIFFIWPREEKTPEIVTLEVEPPEEAALKIPADWKTYRNEEYGFAIRYPKESKMTNESRIDLPSVQGTTLVEKYLTIWAEKTTSGKCFPPRSPRG